MDQRKQWNPHKPLEDWLQGLDQLRKSSLCRWKAATKFLSGQSPTSAHDGDQVPVPTILVRAARCASISFKLPTPPFVRDQADYERDASVVSASKEEREKANEKALKKFLEEERIEYKGKKMSLTKYLEKLKVERRCRAKGEGIDTLNEVAENKERIRRMNEVERNPSATNMSLSPSMEASLELVNMGSGICNKGLWGGTQFSFALFAQPEKIKNVLGKKWAEQEPGKVLKLPEYYNDIIRLSPAYELTLLVVPKKRLSLYQMQREYKKRLAKTLTELNGTEQDHKVLDELVAKFDGNKLRGRVPWLSGTRILPNTMIYFSSAPNGQLKVEVTNPGPLATKSTSNLGMASNPLVTCAVFAELLGRRPISETFKSMTASNMLYFANGFTDGTKVKEVEQINYDGPPTYTTKGFEIKPSIFELGRSSCGKLLFRGKNICETREVVRQEEEVEVDYSAIS